MEKFFLEKDTMFRLYIKGSLRKGEIIKIEGELAFRIVSVLRLREKDKFVLFNGLGGEYKSVIVNVGKKFLEVEIEDFKVQSREQEMEIHLMQGMSRKDRMQYSIQKSCELGVKSITPLFSERCNIKIPNDKIQEKMQHWRNIAISASEQSGRCTTTEIRKPMDFSNALKKTANNIFMGYPKSKMTLKDYNIKTKRDIYLIIGPERGFSDKEYAMALSSGAHLFSMGTRILRSETASVVALSMMKLI